MSLRFSAQLPHIFSSRKKAAYCLLWSLQPGTRRHLTPLEIQHINLFASDIFTEYVKHLSEMDHKELTRRALLVRHILLYYLI